MRSEHINITRKVKMYRPLCRWLSTKATASIVPRSTSYSQWYQTVISSAGLTDATTVRGCAILKPNGYALWEAIQRDLDGRIKAEGATNAYFPLMIPTSFFSKEAQHVDGFAKECAVVTHHRLRAKADGSGVEVDPSAKLSEPYIIRPTSETVIWDAFSRWIQSYRDLPLLINQWANVVRWEMRTRPFLRTSEFLWQEGHTAHASADEALAYAHRIQALYSDFLTQVLAIPHVTGCKSPSERFAGADETLTCEAMMGNGWALQAATSHYLGQHFSRAFGVSFMNAQGGRDVPYATSWGASTRLIGGLIMTHGDDKGVVYPPAIAPVQVVIMHIAPKGKSSAGDTAGPGLAEIAAASSLLESQLKKAGIRVKVDNDVHTPPGSRHWQWETQGVPVRIEIGTRDVTTGSAVMKFRVPMGPSGPARVPLGEGAVDVVRASLSTFQSFLYGSAQDRMAGNIHYCTDFKQLQAHAQAMEETQPQDDAEPVESAAGSSGTPRAHKGAGATGAQPYAPPYRMFLAPWCDNAQAEEAVKAQTKYTIRCFPSGGSIPLHALVQHDGSATPGVQEGARGKTCFYSGKQATHLALFARAF